MSTHEETGATTDRRRMSWGALAWLGIIATIGVVQLFRQQWGDAVIFGVAAVLIAAEALGLLRVGERLRRMPLPALLLAAAAAAVVLTIAPRHSVWAAVALAVAGVGALVAAWAPARAKAPVRRPWPRALKTLAWSWAVIWIVACLWELLQVMLGGTRPGGRESHPALSDLVNPLVDVPVGQALFVVCWLALGVFFITRGGRR